MEKQSALAWLDAAVPPPDETARNAARARQNTLTKPPGSLGRLETIAEQFAAWQGRAIPQLERVRLRVFAADHGIAAQGVSAFPQAVTVQMIQNFCLGGAAVSVLGTVCDADFQVINLGCVAAVEPHPLLLDNTVGPGTADFSRGPAMTEKQLYEAMQAGRAAVSDGEFHLFIGGEMGIGNTSSASALLAARLGLSALELTGPGTGVSGATLLHKQKLVDRALTLHASALANPLSTLQCLGGFEIAALVGAYIAAAQRGIPVLVDGFISTAAAVLACDIRPDVRAWLLFAHQSAEPGHQLALNHLQATPFLDLGMRLGEGSGAALAVPLLQSAIRLHRDMATFTEAGVSNA